MARKPRIDFAGAWHHVMHRGARRAPIFKLEDHCQLFLDLLEDASDAFELEVHAFCLMPNHYHLLVRSRHGNLSRTMKQLNATYTQRVNLRHGWDGPVFRGRFRSQLIQDESQLPYVLAYIHLNPLRSGLVTRLDSPRCWSSHRVYLGRDTSPEWLTTSYFEAVFEDPTVLHRYVLDLHRGKRSWPEQMAMDSGWLKQTGGRALQKSHADEKTRFRSGKEVLAEVCEIAGINMGRLRKVERGPRANPARRFAVWALKKGTLMTHGEIGSLLRMSESQVGHVLRRFRAREEPLATWFEQWRERKR
jgi:REP element-mobilizing transposase RayT